MPPSTSDEPDEFDETDLAVAVLFADLAGFTALTEAHGDEQAAATALRLQELTHGAYDGEAILVKGLGDGVMVVFERVDQAVTGALALLHSVQREPRFPGLRVGLDTGPVVRSAGDVFGATVNVASRVTDRAAPGQVLATGRIRDHPDLPSEIEVVEFGQIRLRHVRDEIEVVELRQHDRPDATIDPVCHMRISPEDHGIIRRTHDGQVVSFCSESCARLFAANTELY